MEFTRSVAPSGDLVISLDGEFDALGASCIRQDLENIVEKGDSQNIVLDLRQVSFIDSSGVGAIVFLFKRLNSTGRKLEITGVSGQPRELLQVLQVDKAIPVQWAI